MKIKNSEFLLEPRHKSLIVGKSTRLYKTWENDEFSYSRLLLVVEMFLFWLLFAWVLYATVTNWYNFYVFGKDTTATVINCSVRKSHSDSDSHSVPHYEYVVEDIVYQGSDSVSGDSACEQLEIGTEITIRYLEFDPQQTRYFHIISGEDIFGVILSLVLTKGIFIFCRMLLRPMISTAKMFRHLKSSGILIEGEIYDSQLVPAPNPVWRDKEIEMLIIEYKFVSPNLGHAIHGERKKWRKDISEENLPKQGTSVTILYVDDECHLLL